MQEVNLIGVLSAGGSRPVIESKTLTENGTYNAPSGVDGFNPVTVNVPTPAPVIESKTIIENGTYNAPSGVDGFSPVVVNVPTPTPDLSTLTVRSNGIYTAQQYNVDGFNIVDVLVPTGATIIVNNDYLIDNYVLQTVPCDFTEGKYYGFVIYDNYTYPRYNYQLGCGIFKRLSGTQNYYWANHMGSISNAIITDSTFTLATVFDSDSSTAKITIFEIGDNIINSVIPV